MTVMINNTVGTRNFKSKASEIVVTIDTLNKPVETHSLIDMADAGYRFRIKNLFVYYRFLLRRYSLSLLTSDIEKIFVYQTQSAICPDSLRRRLKSVSKLSHHALCKTITPR